MAFDLHFCKTCLLRYDDVDLDFLILEFPAVKEKISDGMRKDKKALLLLEHCLVHADDADRLQIVLEQDDQPAAPVESLLEKVEPWNLDFLPQINACIEPAVYARPGPLVGLALRCEDQDVLESFRQRLLRKLNEWLEPGVVVDRRSLMIKTTTTTIEKAIQRVKDDFLPDAQSDSVLFMTQMAGAENVLAFWKSLCDSLQGVDLPNPVFVLLPVESKYCQECPAALSDLGLPDLGEPALAFSDVDLWVQDVGTSCHCADTLKIRWKKHFWEQCRRGELPRAYSYLIRVKTILMKDPSPANIQRQLGL
jgi:hypothetical protein